MGEGLGSFDHHMSGCEVDVGGKGLMFKYVPTKLESGSFNRANV